MSLESIIKNIGIDWTNIYLTWGGSFFFECKFDITPDDFLKFAKQDLQNKDERGIINAITNAKRAIDCQVDTLLSCIGYKPNTDLPQNVKDYIKKQSSSSNETVNITERIKLVSCLEAAPSKLISKIRGIRNLLEHEYSLPTIEQAYEAIELATLFIGTINNVLHTFIDDFEISSEEIKLEEDSRLWKNVMYVTYHDDDNCFHLGTTDKVKQYKKKPDRILKTETQYLELIRLNIAIGISGNIEDALYGLIQTIKCNIPKNKIKVTIII
ncbi:MAG: hypothetical protein ABR958_03570 [Dehalococcoidales bacterium]